MPWQLTSWSFAYSFAVYLLALESIILYTALYPPPRTVSHTEWVLHKYRLSEGMSKTVDATRTRQEYRKPLKQLWWMGTISCIDASGRDRERWEDSVELIEKAFNQTWGIRATEELGRACKSLECEQLKQWWDCSPGERTKEVWFSVCFRI